MGFKSRLSDVRGSLPEIFDMPSSTLRRHDIIGEKDTVSCQRTAQWVTGLSPGMSIETHPDATHYLLSSGQDALAKIKSAILSVQDGRTIPNYHGIIHEGLSIKDLKLFLT